MRPALYKIHSTMNVMKIAPAPGAHDFQLLIKNILAYSLMLEPEREIVYANKHRYNYFALNKRIRQLANALGTLGLGGGNAVAVMDYDSHRYLECYFAIPMTANVLHTINWRLSPAQILYTIRHAKDEVLIVHEDFVPLIESFAGQMPSVRHIIVTTDDTAAVRNNYLHYEPLLAAEPDTYDFPEFDEDAVATMFYTTGTTGDPKGVYYTHRQLVLHTFHLAATFGFVGGATRQASSDDVYMPLTSMFHVHAWGFPYLATMYGMKQVYVGKFDPAVVLQLIRDERPTLSHCVPTILQMLFSKEEEMPTDFTGWKIISGGAAMPESLAKKAIQKGIDLRASYGMSETCPVICSGYIPLHCKDKDIDWQAKARSRTGTPPIFVEMRVVDEHGNEVPHDDTTAGQILVRAPWLTQGYLHDDERGAQLWEGGYLHTGDVATINKHHSIRIADRIKDVIKSGGEWISSLALENYIGQHPWVAEVAVVARADAQWGERPYAMVVPTAGKTITVDMLKEHLQQYIDQGELSKWAMPEHFAWATAIPKTSVGKIDKKAIRLMIQ